ncbi:acyltransferase family protein [Alteromonas gracilis]|uniref:acyltransferase family protein n=1 Tax=Alteromonas gracilis TaxID=1479524 RepID=UPI002FE30B0A
MYLDVVRLSASFMVFFSHLVIVGNPLLWRFSVFSGHFAVLVFFVLSGYVIAYVVFDRKESAQKYTINRVVRIYSVVLPALIVTAICFWAVMRFNPRLIDWALSENSGSLYEYFSVLVMLHQSWQQVSLPTNAPLWSIAFEVFYYLMFGIMVFVNGTQKKTVLIIIVAALMGPNILLYFPLWTLGVATFFINKRIKLSFIQGALLTAVSVMGIATLSLENAVAESAFYSKYVTELFTLTSLNAQSSNFIRDYAVAIFICIHFIGTFFMLRERHIFKERLSSLIKKMSAMTFALYVFHLPLLFLLSAFVIPAEQSVMHASLSLLLIPTLIFFISAAIENTKWVYRSAIIKVLGYQGGRHV